jgi:CRP/FNR family cyclic AMP-dependent transcriptional regulator
MTLTEGMEWEAQNHPAGVEIIRQDKSCGILYVLTSGRVEVLRDGCQLCVIDEPGALFGELSLLLAASASATVRTLSPCSFRAIKDPAQFEARLRSDPEATLVVLRTLAHRLALLDSRYAQLKGVQPENREVGEPAGGG